MPPKPHQCVRVSLPVACSTTQRPRDGSEKLFYPQNRLCQARDKLYVSHNPPGLNQIPTSKTTVLPWKPTFSFSTLRRVRVSSQKPQLHKDHLRCGGGENPNSSTTLSACTGPFKLCSCFILSTVSHSIKHPPTHTPVTGSIPK